MLRIRMSVSTVNVQRVIFHYNKIIIGSNLVASCPKALQCSQNEKHGNALQDEGLKTIIFIF